MAHMLVQNSVKDVNEWKKVFDSVESLRASRGALSNQVFYDAGDPHKVVILTEWKSLETAQAWAASPEMKQAMEKAGVQGPPIVSFLKSV